MITVEHTMSQAPVNETKAETRSQVEGSAARAAPALEAEHLSRAVVGKVLTNDISVQVQTGEVLAIVGPSGSGKSSFLRLLNRLDEPTGGTVRVNGQDFRELAPQELRRGADGAMTGFAYPEMLVEVCRRFFDGDAEGAEDLFDIYLPVVRHEQQAGIGLAIRKEILRRRGVIASATVRAPGPKLNRDDHVELDGLMARLDARLRR